MKPIKDAWFCQIEITNHCFKSCLYCSRYYRHIRHNQKFNMSCQTFEQALLSLKGFPGRIGLIGGEPTLHPEFEKICNIASKHYPKHKLGLWTTGGRLYERYKTLINDTFGLVAYNEHNETQEQACKHQPITIAIQDVIKDENLKNILIDDCWVQRTWCPTISPKGCFFCEVAYALDSILDGQGGYAIEPNWWNKTPIQFQDQVKRYCNLCGMAIPIERELIHTKKEKFSPGLLSKFKELNLPGINADQIEIFDKEITLQDIIKVWNTWYPGNYRGDVANDSNCNEGKGMTWNPSTYNLLIKGEYK